MEIFNSLIDLFIHLDKHLLTIIGQYEYWAYLILFLVIFAETGLVVAPFLPGDSLLFAIGSLSAIPDSILNVHYVAVLLGIAAILGDTANYFVGKYLGNVILNSRKIKFVKEEHILKTNIFFEKYGGKTIILGRFLPIVRTFAPFVAGMARMNYGKFLIYNITGGILWITLFVYSGFLFGNLPIIKNNFSLVVLAIIIISLLPTLFEIAHSYISRFKVSSKQ